jgi:Domain of unknown function (DUF4277)
MSRELIVQNLDHLGIVAGLVDELEIVQQINQRLGEDPREQVNAGGRGESDDSEWIRVRDIAVVSVSAFFCGESYDPFTINWHFDAQNYCAPVAVAMPASDDGNIAKSLYRHQYLDIPR